MKQTILITVVSVLTVGLVLEMLASSGFLISREVSRAAVQKLMER